MFPLYQCTLNQVMIFQKRTHIIEVYFESVVRHWWIQGVLPVHAPPTGSNSFIFAYIFAKKHACQRSAHPQWVSTPLMENPGSATVNKGKEVVDFKIINISHCLYANQIETFRNIGLL